MDEDAVLDAIGDLYEAAVEAARWPQALDGGAYAHFLWNKQTGEVPVMHVAG